MPDQCRCLITRPPGRFVSVLAKEAWLMSEGKGTSLRDFAIALAGIAAAHGAALGFKSRTEPGGDA